MHKNKNSSGSRAAKNVMCFRILDCTKFAVCPYNPYTVADLPSPNGLLVPNRK